MVRYNVVVGNIQHLVVSCRRNGGVRICAYVTVQRGTHRGVMNGGVRERGAKSKDTVGARGGVTRFGTGRIGQIEYSQGSAGNGKPAQC